MKFELNFLPTNATDKDIFEEIRRVDSLVGKDILTRTDFDKHSKFCSGALMHRFGNWHKVLTKADIGHKYSRRQKTNEELINELRRIAKLLNKNSVTVVDVRHNSSIIGPSIIIRRFGSWSNGIKKAGLEISRFGHRYSNEKYFENLLNVWTHYGRQPKSKEMNKPPSEISAVAYGRRFGSWRKALEAFVARMNQDEQVFKKENKEKPIRQEIKKHSVAIEDRPDIPLGLRYKALSRDKFKCVKDGRSPATDPTCRLHIDHIIPFSKGGKTILENLQTLCEDCNLGKGNRHFE